MSTDATATATPAPPRTLTLDEILAAEADVGRRVEPVDVPEWGGRVYVRQMTAAERDEYESSLWNDQGDRVNRDNWRARFLVRVVCDESGRPLFRPEHAAALGQKSAPAVRRVYRAAAALNHVREEDAVAGKGDSGPAPDAG